MVVEACHSSWTADLIPFLFKVSTEDISKAVSILQELTEKTNDTINHVNSLIKKVEEEQMSTAKVHWLFIILWMFYAHNQIKNGKPPTGSF